MFESSQVRISVKVIECHWLHQQMAPLLTHCRQQCSRTLPMLVELVLLLLERHHPNPQLHARSAHILLRSFSLLCFWHCIHAYINMLFKLLFVVLHVNSEFCFFLPCHLPNSDFIYGVTSPSVCSSPFMYSYVILVFPFYL